MIKKKWLTILLIIISLFALVMLVVALRSPAPRGDNGVTRHSPAADTAEEFEGMKIRVPGPEKEGFWELDVAKMVNQDNIGKMDRIEGEYTLNKLVLYTVKAAVGQIFWRNGVLLFQGDVELTAADGKKISAASLLWNSKQKKIVARDKVTMTAKGVLVRTSRLTANLKFDKIIFAGATEVSYQR